jgi:hypothetical protein
MAEAVDCDKRVGAAIQVAFVLGALFAFAAFVIADCMRSCCRCSRVWSIGGNINRSIVQANGRLFVDGVEVGTGANVSVQATRALRITADGQEISRQLQPGTPVVLRMAANTTVSDLHVGTQLSVEEGGLQGYGSVKSGTSMTITGDVVADNVTAGTHLGVGGKLSARENAKAGTSIHVAGDAALAHAKSGTSISIAGVRRRRRSLSSMDESGEE